MARGGITESRRVIPSSLPAALTMPWRLTNELHRLLALPAIRLRFALHGVRWGHGWRIFGMPIIQRHLGSTIVLGDDLSLRSWARSNPLAPDHPCVLATRTEDACIRIGQGCGFTGVVVVAAERIEIGNRVTVGANSTITDTDFHPLHPSDRRNDFNAGGHRPVIIEDEVFIGMSSIILKGVRIGRGSVVGAGSVVSSDIPAGVIAAGNPARALRALPEPGAEDATVR